MDQRGERLPERLDKFYEVAGEVELAQVGWQVLNHRDLVIRQVKDLQVFETQQLRVH